MTKHAVPNVVAFGLEFKPTSNFASNHHLLAFPALHIAITMSVRPAVMRRLMRELVQLKNEPPEGIRVSHPEDDMLDVTGIIEGPAGTPYEGGYFRVKFNFTEEFPEAPPKCRFMTKIFHPNVSSAGEICVNTLKKDWKSSFGIGHILVTVKCLLIYPNPESALDEEAGKLLLENYDDYCSRAKLITSVHASPKNRPPEFDTPSVPTSSSSISTTPSGSSKRAKVAESVVTTTVVSSTSLSTPHVFRKSASPAPQPLQMSTTNSATLPASENVGKEKENDKNKDLVTEIKEVHTGVVPTPLGLADSNSPTLGNASKLPNDSVVASKAVKRPAGGVGTGEKRKKALKRL